MGKGAKPEQMYNGQKPTEKDLSEKKGSVRRRLSSLSAAWGPPGDLSSVPGRFFDCNCNCTHQWWCVLTTCSNGYSGLCREIEPRAFVSFFASRSSPGRALLSSGLPTHVSPAGGRSFGRLCAPSYTRSPTGVYLLPTRSSSSSPTPLASRGKKAVERAHANSEGAFACSHTSRAEEAVPAAGEFLRPDSKKAAELSWAGGNGSLGP